MTELTTATNQMRALLHEPAIRSLPPGRIEQEHADWLQHRHHEQQLAQADWETRTYPRPSGRPIRPSAIRPQLTEAEASADDLTTDLPPQTSHLVSHVGRTPAGQLIARRPD